MEQTETLRLWRPVLRLLNRRPNHMYRAVVQAADRLQAVDQAAAHLAHGSTVITEMEDMSTVIGEDVRDLKVSNWYF